MKYIRFVVGTNRDSPRKTGVVTELKMLLQESDIPKYDRIYIEQFFEQLNRTLPRPPFAKSNWSPDAISWFKDTAQQMIAMFRDVIPLLEENGRFVRMLVTADPGKILYEDTYQIVAESEFY